MAMTRKTLALVASACLVVGPAVLGQAPAKKNAVGSAELDKALAKAHESFAKVLKLENEGAKAAALKEFQTLVLKYRESFPEITPVSGEKTRYVKLILNSRGRGFDAFQFHIPSAGRTYQLSWSIVIPGRLKTGDLAGFNILAANGQDVLFTFPAVKFDVKVAGMSLPEENQWNHYRISGPKLQAGQNYLIWFDFKSDQPVPIATRLRIEPIETAEPPHDPALQKARGKYQASLDALNERYDADIKAARRKYLAAIEKASKAIPKKNAAGRTELAAEADRVNLGDSETSDPRGFHIIRAETGLDERWNDVTLQVRKFVRDDRLKVAAADFDFKPDAAFGVGKTLIIVYTLDGKPGIYAAPSEQNVDLPPPVTPAVKK